MNDLIPRERIAGWQKLKTLVLDSVSSPITKRVYNMALDEFMVWFQQEPRPGFSKATVSAWRASLEARRLGSSSIIVRMSAIRKLAAEAADNGLLAPELAAGISRVKSAKSVGVRTGNWLSLRQAQTLLSAPDTSSLKGLRDRAILAVLLGCALRRSEVAAADVCAYSATGWPLVHRRPRGQAWPHPHGADAGLGENGDRCLDLRSHRRRWSSFSTSASGRPNLRRTVGREGGLADAPILC